MSAPAAMSRNPRSSCATQALAKQHGAWLSMDIYNGEYTATEGKKNGVLEDNLRKDREITA